MPAVAEGLAIAQVGNNIVLSWTAPVRNRDGTTEKLELETAVLVRRVIDIDALVEAQTRVVEPAAAPAPAPGGEEGATVEPGAEGPEGTGPAETEAPAELSTLQPEPGTEPEPESETTAPAPSETDVTPSAPALDPSLSGTAAPDPGAAAAPAPPPSLVIPPFPGVEPLVTMLASALPGELVRHEEPIDPSFIGKRLEYGVAYVNRRGRQSPYGSTVSIEPIDPLPAPTGLSVESADGFVAVAWTVDPSLQDDETVGYTVYRKPEGDESTGLPLNPVPLRVLSFEDRSAPFGASTCYEVRARLLPPPPPPTAPTAPTTAPAGSAPPGQALADRAAASEPTQPAPAPAPAPASSTPSPSPAAPPAPVPPSPADSPAAPEEPADSAVSPSSVETVGGAAESEATGPTTIVPVVPAIANPFGVASDASGEQCLTPTDRFAPRSPEDLVAVPAPSGILLTWRLVNASDLAGYRVYRSDNPNGPFELVGETTVASYNDAEAARGETLFYMVTAFDSSPGRNESARSEVVEVTRPPNP